MSEDGAGPSKPPPNASKTPVKKAATGSTPARPSQLASMRTSSTPGAGSSSPAPTTTPKAVGNLAKRSDSSGAPVAGSGLAFNPANRPTARKLSFKPKVIARTEDQSAAAKASTSSSPSTPSDPSPRGRGRGGAGRGRGRGSFPPPAAIEATASGPFALGPSEAHRVSRGSITARFAPSDNQTPSTIGAFGNSAGLLPRSHLGTVGQGFKEEEKEIYSDDEDDGPGRRVDVSDVKGLDWMAPDTLRKVVEVKKRKKEKIRAGTADPAVKSEPEDMHELPPQDQPTDLALDLDEDDDDESLEDVVHDFIAPSAAEGAANDNAQDDRLYFFQFPSPFPQFLPSSAPSASKPDDPASMDIDPSPLAAGEPSTSQSQDTPSTSTSGGGVLKRSKSVSFAPETKPGSPDEGPPVVDGLIGHLEIYASGKVKMRMRNGMLLDITAGTQPSFLQHAVYIDHGHSSGEDEKQQQKRMIVLGEVGRRFVASPDVEALLDEMDKADVRDREALLSGAVRMDES